MAEAEFRYSDLLPTGADDTPYRLDLVSEGAQDVAVRLVAVDQEGGVGQVILKATVGAPVVERLWKGLVGITLLVHLQYPGPGAIQAVCARELAKQVVEGVVLLVDDDDVLDRHVGLLRRGRAGGQEQDGQRQGW